MQRRRASVRLLLVSALAVLGLSVPATATATTLPAQFDDALIANVTAPTAIAFMPDGRMLVTTQPGQVRVIAGGILVPTPALNLSGRICTNSERGVLGVAADPDPATKALYLYYSARGGTDASWPTSDGSTPNKDGAPRNRVSKFVIGADNVIDPASEVILLDGIYSPGGNHNAGDLAVGKDGNLYVSVGDGGCDYAGGGCGGGNDASRDRNVLNGKIVRITRSGGVPTDNPFTGSGTASCKLGPAAAGLTCQEAFAVGLRNPFRFAFDPNAADTQFRINDVGQNLWEEIDQGTKGADYGWNAREGHCANGSTTSCTPDPKYTEPLYDYLHSSGCASITGGAFVPNGIWPGYDGGYLFSDYVCGKIFLLGADGKTRTDFATNLGGSSAVHLEFGPYNGSQALYYTSYAGGGQVRRIAYTGTQNRPPTAAIAANPTSGAAPLDVAFDGSGSTDPDGDALTYAWTFGDGTTGTGRTIVHRYAQGSFTATLTVTDSRGAASAPVTTAISSGNTAPTVTITSPAASDLFTVGATYTLTGTATDAQDGPLPDTKLSWTVIKHHDQHTHPFLEPTAGNNVKIVAPAPEDLLAATNSYLEIQLTATDSNGLSTTVSQNFQPKKVPITVATVPAGRAVSVNSSAVTGPTTVTSWAGATLNLAAATQTDAAGRTYAFDRWSDAGAASHAFTTPSDPATLTATFSLRGLQGAYFDGLDFTGTRVDRLDPTIGFDWGRGAPVAGIGAETFSARWTGQISPRYTQTYTFTTTSDDGIRVWVNGVQVINQWNDHSARQDSGTIALVANIRYAIVVEFYDNTLDAVAQLRWSSPSQPAEVVPADRLFPAYAVNFQPAGAVVPLGYVADTGSVFGAKAGLTYGWNADNAAQTRDRNSNLSADQRYDTLTHLQKPVNPNASWEIAVPNGTYQVRIVTGDPTAIDSTFRLNAESVTVVNGTPTSAARWLDGTSTVPVADGRLSITNAPGASNNKIDFIEVTLQ